MKIKSIEVLNDGMESEEANKLWDQIVGFAAYSFNASHSVEYTLISYICMYLKEKFPAEYYCGLLSVVEASKRSPILTEMTERGIKIMTPDINHSEDVFVPFGESAIICPFSAIKGVSETASKAIMLAREAGPFESKEDFVSRVEKRKCNSRVVGFLDDVGAFAEIEGQVPADDQSRRKDQVRLLEGLISEAVIITRNTDLSEQQGLALVQTIKDMREHVFESIGAKQSCPKPMIKDMPKMVIVLDAPSRNEEANDEMGHGAAAGFINLAMTRAGMPFKKAYVTSLYKVVKPKAGYSNEFKSEVSGFLDRELDVIRPKLIVAMGQDAAKYLIPNIPGKVADSEGRVFYDAERDCNILVGMNPNRVIYDESKQVIVDEIMAKAVAMVEDV